MTLSIFSFVLSIIFIALFFVFSLVSYFDANKKKFNFRNSFPHEINNYRLTRDNVYGKISFVVSIISLLFFFSTYPIGLTGYHFGLAMYVALAGIMGALAMAIVVFVPFTNLKFRLIGDVTLFTSVFALNVGIGFFALWDLRDKTIDINLLKVSIGIIALLIGIALIAFVANPKMKKWNKLEEKKSADGTISYDRPKWVILAYTEWIYLVAIFIDALLLVTII